MTAPESIQQLVERFKEQLADYKSGRYNETQLRNDFLDPLFEALGWDVNNRKNYSERFREVVKEASVEVDGAAKAADYAFQSGGNAHFLVEAKKPSVNIETSAEAAFQIRRYAWSKKLGISVLSDFEQLAIYDCRQKPSHGDAAHVGRMNLYSFKEYAVKWDEIYGLLSFEAVHQGSLDKYIETSKGKRGTADVDDDFLAEMEGWREHLARNIALRNPGLNYRAINSAVQLIIDRIIFLRICEDRGIEPENGLRDATDGIDVYGDLMELFRKADKRYNSGLFHFETEKGQSSHPDKLTPTLKIDDKVFKDILANLYPPKSPYAFKYFSAEILGQVYERFLGKVIRLTEGGHAKVEEKPEVRKAGGVYYTPTYIVDYIVKNTLGELLKDKTPAELLLEPVRVLDPACGSGSFLLGAYQYLLDWTLDWYVQHDPARWAKGKNPPLFETGDGYQLTMGKKKELLTAHIFGVDIDPQAVEVTKLSLLLKVVENPGQLTLLGERLLPDLGDNIKCGNSLIGPDYYDGRQMALFDEDERYRVNAFDWQAEFPHVYKIGGFDAIVGNPPYGALFNKQETEYLFEKFNLQEYQLDSYLLFIEQFLNLVQRGRLVGLIIPNTWLLNLLSPRIRKMVFEKVKIVKIVHFRYKVFEDATVDTEIVIFNNSKPESTHLIEIEIREKSGFSNHKIPQDRWIQGRGKPVNIFEKMEYSSLADKINNHMKLEQNYSTTQGTKPFQVGKGKPKQTKKIVDEKPFVSEKQKDSSFRPLLRGSLIQKYQIFWKNDYWISFGDWLAEPRYSANYDSREKIVIRQTGDSLIATLDTNQFIVRDNLYTIVSRNHDNLRYLLGLLNSKLLNWYYQVIINPEKGEALAQVKRGHISILPIRTINFSDPTEVKQHDRLVALVEQMLALYKQSAAAKLPGEQERIQREIEMTDRQIDKLVYELYGLSEEEIRIVEGTS